MKWRGLSFYFNFICYGQDYARDLYELYYGEQKEWKTKRKGELK